MVNESLLKMPAGTGVGADGTGGNEGAAFSEFVQASVFLIPLSLDSYFIVTTSTREANMAQSF